MPSRTVRILLLPAPLCGLLLAGCSQPSASGPSGTAASPGVSAAVAQAPGQTRSAAAGAAPAAPGPMEPLPLPAQADAGAAGGGSSPLTKNAGSVTSVTPLDLGIAQGRIERTVSARYVVPHGGFLDAFSAVVRRATSLGGFVVDSTTTPDATGRIASGTVTLKVPAASLSDLIGGLPADLTVSSLDYGSQDHTAETVDLDARLAAATAHRTALERLRDRTGSVAEIATLEQEIADVQLQVDQTQGALNAVTSRVDLATASIALAEKGVRPVPAPVHRADPLLLGALRTGAQNALQIVAGGVLVLVTVLPLAVLGLAAWLGRRRLRRLLTPNASV
jgi:type IV secretory pathway VirB2 component (pilin)